MNTPDKYELPPLPQGYCANEIRPNYARQIFLENQVRDYALSAIEPYAKRIAELESQLEAIGAGGVTQGQRLIEADRKQRVEPYNYKRIGWELERTAMGDGFYGNALRVAKDIPGVSSEDRAVLDRYATGTQQGTDHIALQNIARNIYMTPQPAESAKTNDICQECGGDGTGGEHEDD